MCYVKIYRPDQNIEDHFKKTWLSLKGVSCLQVIFVLIWVKKTPIWFNLQRDGTGNGLSNINDTFCRKFAATNVSSAPTYVHLQGSCLSISYDGWAKYKDQVCDVSDPDQNVAKTWHSQLKFT